MGVPGPEKDVEEEKVRQVNHIKRCEETRMAGGRLILAADHAMFEILDSKCPLLYSTLLCFILRTCRSKCAIVF